MLAHLILYSVQVVMEFGKFLGMCCLAKTYVFFGLLQLYAKITEEEV